MRMVKGKVTRLNMTNGITYQYGMCSPKSNHADPPHIRAACVATKGKTSSCGGKRRRIAMYLFNAIMETSCNRKAMCSAVVTVVVALAYSIAE